MKSTPLVASLLVAGLLAGCTDASEGSKPIVITDPDDFGYLNQTAGPDVAHIHDYWDGKTVLTVIETAEARDFLVNGDSAGYAEEMFRPDAGSIVPLGTEEVHITINWDDDPANGNHRIGDGPMRLAIKTAADAERTPFAEIQPGETMVFHSTNEQNDIPHQRLSAWQFWVEWAAPIERPTDSGGHESYNIEFTVVVEAKRGLEIPPYPAHPDAWDDQHELVLVDTGEYSYEWFDFGRDGNCGVYCNNQPIEIAPTEGAIVPHDADHIIAEVTNRQNEPHEQATADLFLHYQDARQWDYQPAELISEQGDTRIYRIEIDNNADSPYALQSVWHFTLYIDDEPNSTRNSIGDVSMTVKVAKEEGP